jgi:hypothetical protein
VAPQLRAIANKLPPKDKDFNVENTIPGCKRLAVIALSSSSDQ